MNNLNYNYRKFVEKIFRVSSVLSAIILINLKVKIYEGSEVPELSNGIMNIL